MKKQFKNRKRVRTDLSAKEGRKLASWKEIDKDNSLCALYYKKLEVISDEEYPKFIEYCKSSLPLTFRITQNREKSKDIKRVFLNKYYSKLKETNFEGVVCAPQKLKFYPNELGYHIDVTKSIVKKNSEFSKFQKFLVMETEAGNTFRQEAVSMIPVLLLDIKPHHFVLDMCAAPGSKTTQLIENLHDTDDFKGPTGFILANDSDYRRCHMLVHQTKKLASPNFIVVNHDSQLFPNIRLDSSKNYVKFDRILCDVPCSGDGTLRKNFNVWKDFNLNNALGLHIIQSRILNRGLELLKPGGKLVYSTCSMSPIENEAVVAQALKKWTNSVKLLETADLLPGLERRNGLTSWKVLDSDLNEIEKNTTRLASPTVYPPLKEDLDGFGLEKCLRIYPHLQNTGGFFLALFEKENVDQQKSKMSTDEILSKSQNSTISNVDLKVEDGATQPILKAKKSVSNEEPFVFLKNDHSELDKSLKFFGINNSFFKNSVFIRNESTDKIKTMYFVNPIIQKLLELNQHKLKFVYSGVKLFSNYKSSDETFPWRCQNECLDFLKHHMSDKRIINCNSKLFKFLLENPYIKLHHVKISDIDPDFFQKLELIEDGCFFLKFTPDLKISNFFSIYPLWKEKNCLNLLVNKNNIEELLLRIFDVESHSNLKNEVHDPLPLDNAQI